MVSSPRRHKTFSVAMWGVFAVVLLACCCASGSPSLDKFEQMLIDLPVAANCESALEELTRAPHVFGVANVTEPIIRRVTAALQAFGADASTELMPFSALSQLPVIRKVSLKLNSSGSAQQLDLDEAVVAQDPTSR